MFCYHLWLCMPSATKTINYDQLIGIKNYVLTLLLTLLIISKDYDTNKLINSHFIVVTSLFLYLSCLYFLCYKKQYLRFFHYTVFFKKIFMQSQVFFDIFISLQSQIYLNQTGLLKQICHVFVTNLFHYNKFNDDLTDLIFLTTNLLNFDRFIHYRQIIYLWSQIYFNLTYLVKIARFIFLLTTDLFHVNILIKI